MSNASARRKTLPTCFHPFLIMSWRWLGFESSPQKYGGFPALASAKPERIAKKHDIAGWSTSLNFIGPLTRASSWLPTRAHMWSIKPHYLEKVLRRPHSRASGWGLVGYHLSPVFPHGHSAKGEGNQHRN